MLQCIGCRCLTDDGEGWLSFLVTDPDTGSDAEVATYCPVCANREIRPVRHAAGYQ